MRDDEESDEKIQLKVLEAQRKSVKLPFIRKVSKDGVMIPVNGEQLKLKQGQIIICDIVSLDFLSKSLRVEALDRALSLTRYNSMKP